MERINQKPTPITDIHSLKIGAIIQYRITGDVYTVNDITIDGRVFAVRQVEVSNADEWLLVWDDEE